MQSAAGTPWEVRIAQEGDLPAALEVQRDAFGRVASELGIPPASLPALRESADALREAVGCGTVVLVACDAGGVIGSVRGTRRDDGWVEIGRLVVRSGHEGRGVGSALMRAIEDRFELGSGFILFTGADTLETQRFYQKRGYMVSHREDVGAYGIVWMSKPRPVAAD